MGPAMVSDSTREKELPRHMTMLNQLLEKQPFLMGAEFSVADVAVGSLVTYCQGLFQLDLSEYPAVVSYIERLAERLPYQKAILER
jgi:glutathione S-transferase